MLRYPTYNLFQTYNNVDFSISKLVKYAKRMNIS